VVFARLTLLVGVAILFRIAFAQDAETLPPPSLTLTSHQTFLIWQKGLDYDAWRVGAGHRFNLASGGTASIDQRLEAQLWRPPDSHRQWKGDGSLKFALRQPVMPPFLLASKGEFDFFNDDRTEIYRGLLTAGGVWRANEAVEITGGLGPVYEKRWGRKRGGPLFEAAASLKTATERCEMSGRLKNLPEVKESELRIAADLDYSLSDAASDRVELRYSTITSPEFAMDVQALSRRCDERLAFDNLLKTQPANEIQFQWRSNLARQRASHFFIDNNYSDFEFNWNNDLSVVYQPVGWRFVSSGGLDLQEQQYAGSLTQGRRMHLGTAVCLLPQLIDSTSLSVRVINYRFDTPDPNDYNDRDELRYITRWTLGSRLTSAVGIRLKVEADLNHLVYIYRDRSDDNRWQRLFTFSVETPWRTSNIDNLARFTISANYSIYDFAPYSETFSRAYRAYRADDSLDISLTDALSLQIGGQLTLEDNGGMHWRRWVQNVAEDGYASNLKVLPLYKWRGGRAGAGWSLTYRRTDEHLASGARRGLESVHSSGPVFHFELKHRKLDIQLNAIWLNVHDRLRGEYFLPDVRLALNYAG